MFPKFVGNYSIFGYIGQRIIYNSKYIISNSIAYVSINCILYLYNRIKHNLSNKALYKNESFS